MTKMSLTPKEVVARTLWGEARGESFDGKFGVASVIWTRAKGDLSKLDDVCLRKAQFSCWNDGTLELVKIDTESDAWMECWTIASAMYAVGGFIPLFDATHYHATYVKPYWVEGMTFIRKIGNHRFYKGV